MTTEPIHIILGNKLPYLPVFRVGNKEDTCKPISQPERERQQAIKRKGRMKEDGEDVGYEKGGWRNEEGKRKEVEARREI